MVGIPGQGDHNERTTPSNTQVLLDLGLSRVRERNARSCRISKWPLCIFRDFDLPDLIHKGSCPCLKACPSQNLSNKSMGFPNPTQTFSLALKCTARIFPAFTTLFQRLSSWVVTAFLCVAFVQQNPATCMFEVTTHIFPTFNLEGL